MIDSAVFGGALDQHWPFWIVTFTLVVAAVIDGYKLKVPNWITFPMILSGWAIDTVSFGWEGLGWSLVGTAVGLALLLPAYAIGGMGAGDVKLLAGVGTLGRRHDNVVRLLHPGHYRGHNLRGHGLVSPAPTWTTTFNS